MVIEENTKWLFELKDKVPDFLNKLKGVKKPGFYHYSLSGDYYEETINWGLGNAVFFLKIMYTLGLESRFPQEISDAINLVKKFQKKDGKFVDPLVTKLSRLPRIKKAIKNLDPAFLSNEKVHRGETRQSISALDMFGEKANYQYKNVPQNERQIDQYLHELDWKFPWDAGSHFSILLFFLQHSDLNNKENLIDYAIKWVGNLQNHENGFWYEGNPSPFQKINGAMKILTGLKAVNRMNFKHAEKIIDHCLFAANNRHACDNFNIVYVLKYCHHLTEGNYNAREIESFMSHRLEIYKNYYYPEIGGFSFLPNKANIWYYGAKISKGLNEPDIHGTSMFLYGIAMIAQVLKINDKLKFKEFIP